jgi:short subunit dehydrogenase-like uncharacterized protein
VVTTIAVYGAYGHTGRFVVAELIARGLTPILAGRDVDKLGSMDGDRRQADVGNPAALDRALDGAAAVINCAGPFARTSEPLIDAAVRARIPYLDVCAEIEAIEDVYWKYGRSRPDPGTAIIPAVAFFGGLSDLLVTAALGEWTAVDEVTIAYGLDHWWPTDGTRKTSQVSGERRNGRAVFTNGRIQLRTDDEPVADWTFPEPLGKQTVMAEFTMADSVLIPRHVRTPQINTFMTMSAIKDVVDPNTSPPPFAQRSAQTFLVEVVVRSGAAERRAIARGRDIYAVSAPLVVEATERLLDGRCTSTGVLAPGEAFDAHDFLTSLGLLAKLP